jgi:hypothetical protein
MDKGYLEFFSFFFFIKNNNYITNFLNYKLYKFNYFEEILFLIVLTFFIYFFFFLNIINYNNILILFLLAVPKKRKPINAFFVKIKKKNVKKMVFNLLKK